MKKINPIHEAAIYALGTTAGIVLGTVLATYLVEKMRSSSSPATLPPLTTTPSPIPGTLTV